MSDPFAQIGPKLIEARNAAGLELAEAARLAQVPRAAAEALESEDFSYFSSPVYAKSFLLQYSEYLNVDAKQWLDALAPGSFMASGALLKGPEAPARKGNEEMTPDEKSGMMAVIILLLVTAALVVAVIKGYEFFETRLGDDAPPVRHESGKDTVPAEPTPGTGMPGAGGVR